MLFVHEMQTSTALLPSLLSRVAVCRADAAPVHGRKVASGTLATTSQAAVVGRKTIQPFALWLWGWIVSACDFSHLPCVAERQALITCIS